MNLFSEVEDSISSLPDDLLSHILSFLPTLHAVRTSALSKRWRHVWRSVQTLHFDNLQWWNSRDSLADLILCQNSKTIQKLHLLHCTRIEEDMSRIVTLLGRKIRELDICLPVCLPPDLMQCLCYSETLEVLKIRCNFAVHASILVGFQRLKVLHLQIWNPYRVSIETLFRSCPVLEELVLDCCTCAWNRTFEIFVPTLKRLSIRVSHVRCCKFDVRTPALECLDIIDFEFSRYKMGDMPCLKKVKLRGVISHFGDANRAMQLLSAVANTSSLSLSAATLCILDSVRAMNLPSLPNLTRLELHVFHGFSWNLVIEFLKNSPKLKIFVLRKENEMCWHCLDAQSWTPQPFSPSCLLLHIKVIEIMGFKGQQDELELVEYLLKNAKVIEKLIIDSRKLDPKDLICKNLFTQGLKSQKSN